MGSQTEYKFQKPGLKTGMDFRGQENDMFWSGIGSEFEEPGGTPPTRIPRSTSKKKLFISLVECYKTVFGLNGLNLEGFFEFNAND